MKGKKKKKKKKAPTRYLINLAPNSTQPSRTQDRCRKTSKNHRSKSPTITHQPSHTENSGACIHSDLRGNGHRYYTYLNVLLILASASLLLMRCLMYLISHSLSNTRWCCGSYQSYTKAITFTNKLVLGCCFCWRLEYKPPNTENHGPVA